ncbi:MAG: hypothetical protein HQ511_02805 [Rhodospirillales bacterium]|nr:hypothetical protein [Rhodospirillales bacterium]
MRKRKIILSVLLTVGLLPLSGCDMLFGEFETDYTVPGETEYSGRDVYDDTYFWDKDKMDTPGVNYQSLEGGYTIWKIEKPVPLGPGEYPSPFASDRTKTTNRRVFDPYGNEMPEYSIGKDPREMASGFDTIYRPQFDPLGVQKRDRALWDRRRAEQQQQIQAIQRQTQRPMPVHRGHRGPPAIPPPVPVRPPPAPVHRGHLHRGG